MGSLDVADEHVFAFSPNKEEPTPKKRPLAIITDFEQENDIEQKPQFISPKEL